MAYIENFNSKLDWAMPFQRSGKFPLDRSSIFSSYADALKYAKQDESDTRKLGGTSYVGQIIVVHGNNQEGNAEEVAAYIITAVGASAALMKLAQTTATGDFANDIAALQTALGAVSERVTAVEEAVKNIEEDTDTTYSFASGETTDGAIKVTTHNPDGSTSSAEVQVKGWQALVSLATGRTSAYVYANKDATDYLTDIKTPNKYKKGDVIYFTDNNIADEWVTGVLTTADAEGCYYTFSNLETEHPDLTQYLTLTQAAQTYATKDDVNAKANQSALTALETKVNDNKSAADTAISGLQGEIDAVEEALGKIDVSAQITAKINELDVDKVGGAEGSYIKSIEQIDGKITAVAATLPDYDSNAQAKADKALEDAKAYTDAQVGEIGSDTTVKDYVDSSVEAHNTLVTTELGKVANRVKVIEDAKYGDEISALKTSVGTNTTEISTLKTNLETTTAVATKARDDVAALGTKVGTIETAVNKNTEDISTLSTNLETAKTELNTAIAGRVKKIQVGGVDQVMSEDGTVNITSVSTDLLTQGSNMLVLDCLNASLTDEQ